MISEEVFLQHKSSGFARVSHRFLTSGCSQLFFRCWPAFPDSPSVGSRGAKPKASAGPGVLPIFFNTRLPLFAFPTPHHNVVSAPSWFFGLAVFPRRSSFQCQNCCLQWLAMLFFVENSSAEAPSVSTVALTNNCDRP